MATVRKAKIRKWKATNELDRCLGPECPGELLQARRRPKAIGAALWGQLAEELADHKDLGRVRGHSVRALRAARDEWATLPEAEFNKLAVEGVSQMVEGYWDGSLSEYIETRLELLLAEHVQVAFHGRNNRLQIKATTKWGQRVLTAAYEANAILNQDVRSALAALWAAAPDMTDVELAATVAAQEAA